MKRKVVFPCSTDKGYVKFAVLSYVISALLVFSGSASVWAKAPATAKIVFMSKRDGNAEIYIMNPDGSEQVNLSQHPAADYDPAWSPNGKQILFSSDRDGGVFDLYLMDADGRNVQKVFEDSAYRRNPNWSPDGKQIVYAQGDPQKAKLHFGLRLIPLADLTLYVATLKGDSVEKLTDGFMPSWVIDGSEIAFVVGGIEHTPLGIFDLQTHIQKMLLLKEMPWIIHPSWSPQGDKIAFTEINRAGFDGQGFLSFEDSVLYVTNNDGIGLHQITKDEEDFPSDPTWSPHGDELIYTALVLEPGQGGAQLFKTDLNGGNPTQLTHDGSNSSPDWFDPTLSVSPSVQLSTTMWGEIKAD